ncbi:hypothetical protein BGZ52_005184 [Haplosporangium bisporale]|nr:hypothetical protein BGZ52_005184 [Haplosporangium bisporale]KFH64598.1 hypothetical protein MVEG_09331 [Podila verticillata NRRL 6337]
MVKFTFALFAAAVVGTLSMAAPVTKRADSSIFAASNRYSGKATWFTDSYGSCNVHWDGNTQPIVAMSALMMGAESWGNPACDKLVRITLKSDPSKSVEARVVDKCPGDECAYGSLDLSPAAFQQLGDLGTGILDIEWSFV